MISDTQSNDASNNEVLNDDAVVVSMSQNTNTEASLQIGLVARESINDSSNQGAATKTIYATLPQSESSVKGALCSAKGVTNLIKSYLPTIDSKVIRSQNLDSNITKTVTISQRTPVTHFTASTSEPSNTNCVELQTVTTEEIQNQDFIPKSAEINESETLSQTVQKNNCSTESISEPSTLPTSKPQVVIKGDKGFQCQECGKYFTRKTSLERHYRVHTGERPFKCEVCGKQYSQKSVLQRHLVTHDELKPYQCQLCQKMFSEKTALRRHYETHSQAKPHKCHLCGKAFGLKEYLSKHMFLHKGLKPFKCNVCGKSFADSSAYKRHCATHDETKVKLLCSSCSKTFKTPRTLKMHQQKCQLHLLRNLQTTVEIRK